MARKKSIIVDLLKIVSEIFSQLPGWAVILFPPVIGAVSYFTVKFLIQNRWQTMFPGDIGFFLTNIITIFIFGFTSIAALKGFIAQRSRKDLLKNTLSIDELKLLDWEQFELLIAEIYRREGFSVEEKGGRGPDGGIDIKAKAPNGEVHIIQCKHYRTSKVGVKFVRELYGVLYRESADKAVLVATGDYTNDAVEFAKGQNIELIDGKKLVQRIKSLNSKQLLNEISNAEKISTESRTPTKEPLINSSKLCPKCGAELTKRISRRGSNRGNEFWGCSKFPQCKYTET